MTQEEIKPYSEQGEKKEQVEVMFDNIAPTYDFLNHALSMGTDKGWRRKAIDRLGQYKPQRILDIATGTGDFAILAAQRLGPTPAGLSITACDLSEGMMEVGRQKVEKLGLSDVIRFQKEDCLKLSFPDNSFDAVTVAYGVRNFQDLKAGLREMLRVLRPNGHLLILELATPPHFPMKQLFWLYSHVWMPLMGRLISRDKAAYTYLPATMEAFPQGEVMEKILKDCGYTNVEWKRFTFGLCTMYIASPTPAGLFGLIGYPLGHSFSRKFFTEKFEQEGIDAEYLNFEIPDAKMLLDVVRQNPTLKGLNCTIPHKQAILPLMDQLHPMAARIGAVNTIKIIPQGAPLPFGGEAGERGALIGYNTDIIGFTESIKPLLKPHHTKALVLGTGGASKAICVALEELGIEWRYVSRKSSPLPARGGQGERLLTYSDITPDIIAEYTVIINCSPVGMHPHTDECPALPYEAMTERHLLFDLVYNPLETLFMRRGAEHGATVKNGLEMLHLQALASWRFWNE